MNPIRKSLHYECSNCSKLHETKVDALECCTKYELIKKQILNGVVCSKCHRNFYFSEREEEGIYYIENAHTFYEKEKHIYKDIGFFHKSCFYKIKTKKLDTYLLKLPEEIKRYDSFNQIREPKLNTLKDLKVKYEKGISGFGDKLYEYEQGKEFTKEWIKNEAIRWIIESEKLEIISKSNNEDIGDLDMSYYDNQFDCFDNYKKDTKNCDFKIIKNWIKYFFNITDKDILKYNGK